MTNQLKNIAPKFTGLVKREFLDGKNGYLYAPLALAGLMLLLILLALVDVGNTIRIDGMEMSGVSSLSEALEKGVAQGEQEQIAGGIALLYWGLSLIIWLAFPFVLVNSLLSSLYEERRDKSILFWKSMPIADWQEVAAKFFTSVFVAFGSYLAITITLQVTVAVILSIVVIFQGGPVLELWPIGNMIYTWVSIVPHYVLVILWALPVIAWITLVSAYAPRMPFMYAFLPPVALIVVEQILTETQYVADWIGYHMGGWEQIMENQFPRHINGPAEAFAAIKGLSFSDLYIHTLSLPTFWGGVILAAVFLYGAVELRKRAM